MMRKAEPLRMPLIIAPSWAEYHKWQLEHRLSYRDARVCLELHHIRGYSKRHYIRVGQWWKAPMFLNGHGEFNRYCKLGDYTEITTEEFLEMRCVEKLRKEFPLKSASALTRVALRRRISSTLKAALGRLARTA